MTEQLHGYHKRRIVARRKRRPRKQDNRDHLSNILAEIEGDCTDIEQALFVGLATAVERLRVMPHDDLPEFIDLYLADEIRSQGTEYYAADSSHIQPNASTNCGRKKQGRERYDKLTRVGTEDEEVANQLEALPSHTTTITGEKGSGQYLPSRLVEQLQNLNGFESPSDLIDDIAENDVERRILEMLFADYRDIEIISSLDLSSHRFFAIRNSLRIRLARLTGIDLPRLRQAS